MNCRCCKPLEPERVAKGLKYCGACTKGAAPMLSLARGARVMEECNPRENQNDLWQNATSSPRAYKSGVFVKKSYLKKVKRVP